MEKVRKPFQGVLNIIRFNWHFYFIAFALILFLIFISGFFGRSVLMFFNIICFVIAASTLISLLASIYVYDLSGIYDMNWIREDNSAKLIVNVNAGFDETSVLLASKFKNAKLVVLDFYDPALHTEVSIKRARKAYPPYPETRQIKTSDLGLDNNSADKIFAILAAHEIRDENERLIFFNELHKVLKTDGEVYVTEHLRDFANFLAYNFGFFHFFSKDNWLRVFKASGFKIKKEIKLTPFISTFILSKNGNTF